MKYVVTINHDHYVVSDETKALAIIKSLMGAVQVRENAPYNGTSFRLVGSVSTTLAPYNTKAKLFADNEATGTEEEVTEAPTPKPRKQIGKPQLLLGS